MHRTTYTSLVAACLATSAAAQHDKGVGNYPLDESLFDMNPSGYSTLRFVGNMTSLSKADSAGNWHLKYPEYASGAVSTSKTRTGETQFLTFGAPGVVGLDSALRIDRGNVNCGAGLGGGLVETLFLFETHDKLQLVRTTSQNTTEYPQYEGIPSANELCSLSEKVFEKKKNPGCDDVTFPKTTHDLATWNMGFENSQGVATSWNGTNRINDPPAMLFYGAKLGYPFVPSSCLDAFNGNWFDVQHDKNTTSNSSTWPNSSFTVGHWMTYHDDIDIDNAATWSVGLDGKWKGIPTAFDRSINEIVSVHPLNIKKMTINARVEPYELKNTDGRVLKKEELFPQVPHFPKCHFQ